MYSAYLKERENKDIVESDSGFAIYGYDCLPGLDVPHVYLQDVYVKPECRRKHAASGLADKIASLAKAKGYQIMFTSVDCGARSSHKSLQVVMGYGFKLYAANDNVIYFCKEI